MKILSISILLLLHLVQGQFFKLFHDGSYDFNYHTSEDQHRSEIRYPDGTVAGKYAYVAPNGQRIQVEYTAGKRGYRERRKLSNIRRPVLRIQSRPLDGLNFGSQFLGISNPPTTFSTSPIDGSFHQFTPAISSKPNRLDEHLLVTTWKPPFAENFVTQSIDNNDTPRKLIFRQPVRLLTVTERPSHSISSTSSGGEDSILSSTVSSINKSDGNGSVTINNLGTSGVEDKSFEIILPDMLTKDQLQLEELDPEIVSNIQKDIEKIQSQLQIRQNNNSPLPTNGFLLPPNENIESFGNRIIISNNQQTPFNFPPTRQTTMSLLSSTAVSPLQSSRTPFGSSVSPTPFGSLSNFEPQRIQQQTLPPFGPVPSPGIQEWFNDKPLPFPPANELNQPQQQIRLPPVNKNIYSTPFRVPISYHFPDQRVPYPIVSQNNVIQPRMD